MNGEGTLDQEEGPSTNETPFKTMLMNKLKADETYTTTVVVQSRRESNVGEGKLSIYFVIQ